MQHQQLRTPISYYGGKQTIAKKIIDIIPEHTVYCEPFLGGAAIYFAKEPSEVEVINDTNKELINFYKVCKTRFHELQALVRVTLHSRDQHDDAWCIYNKPHLHDEVRRAWAVWVLSTQSFSSMLDGSWGYDKKKRTTTNKISHKREQFTEEIAMRLQNTQVECADALYIIGSRDTNKTFFYCDPPYPKTHLGHYDGYTMDDFIKLLTKLSKIEGKFLLSSYPYEELQQFIEKFGWHSVSYEQNLTACGAEYRKKKIEVLTANYPIKKAK